ncbi:MAG TPA: GAF domain-containing protein [Anaerolineae bacterium]|nr:GAF domain-containing protein [Anaerolineae bacterium]HOQ99933.1 GAF domain-containing protein [Anaerolineae bacterium]HPL26838.1 GAF domain-containing protein [Anaerolineae bacterium]
MSELLHPLDLLTLDELQGLQDSVAAASGAYASFRTPVGQPLTRTAPGPAVCALLEHGACREPDLLCGFASSRWRRALVESGRAVLTRCPHCDLQLAAVPLVVRGRLLATLVYGRVPAAPPGDAWLRQQAQRLRVDASALRAALLAMPVCDEARFAADVGHIERGVGLLANLAEARLAGQHASHALEMTNRRLGTLGAIAAAVIRSSTWQESLGQALQTVLDVLRLDSGAVFVRSEEVGEPHLVAHRGVGPEYVALVASDALRNATASRLFQEAAEPWIVPDVAQEPGLPLPLFEQLQVGAFVAVPLRAVEETLGMLTVHAAQVHAFQPDEIALIVAAGEQIGIGIQGLRLIAAEKRRAGELAVLNEVALAVGRSLDLQVIVEQALGAVLKSFRAGAGLLYLLDERTGTLALAAHRGLSNEASAAWAAQPPLGCDAAQGLDSRARWGSNMPAVCSRPDLALAEGLVSYISAPLRGQQRPRGLLAVFTREQRTLLANEVELFQAVAHEVGLAVENAELYRETQRRLADLEALQHFNERILHTMQEGIFIVSLRGKISYATPRLAELTGLAVPELLGADWLSLAGPVEHATLRQMLQAVIAGRSMRHEFDLARADGQGRHVLVGAVPLSDGGAVSGMLGVVSDLSEEVQLRRRLRQAEKLSAIGELVSGVAHELNNPLTVIRGYAQLLQGREAGGDSRELAAITDHAERAARIVQGLLTFARERPPVYGVVDLNAVLQSVLDMREPHMAEAHIAVQHNLAAALPRLRGDPYQLQQVFLNIIINAEQALTEAGAAGLITVTTTLTPDGMVLAAIANDGPGIPAAVADRIFDPFFTTKADRQGTGLGLSICYGIVNAHGGRIWVDSEEHGATFFVALPVVVAEAAATEPPRPAEPATASGHHVLVVEDEVEIGRLEARFLERLGYRVTVVNEARAALRALADEYPDVILTDLKMPGMDGREFFAALQHSNPELARRVIFVTGDTVSPDTQAFLSQTGRPHLAKPFSLDDVRALVAEALEAQS